MSDYCFTSTLFQVEPGEDAETNPQVYGKQLAHWLKEKFLGLGYSVDEVIGEDWGYCVMFKRDPFLLWVGCQNVPGKDRQNDPQFVPQPNEIIWHCFAVVEVPFFYLKTILKGLVGQIKTKPALAKLDADLEKILRAEPGIELVEGF